MKGGIVWIMALSCDYRFLFLSVFYVGHPDSLFGQTEGVSGRSG